MYITGYAMLFAIETGVRVGELCALKWDDVYENYIHIHAQQLFQSVDGKKEIYYAPFTKTKKAYLPMEDSFHSQMPLKSY